MNQAGPYLGLSLLNIREAFSLLHSLKFNSPTILAGSSFLLIGKA